MNSVWYSMTEPEMTSSFLFRLGSHSPQDEKLLGVFSRTIQRSIMDHISTAPLNWLTESMIHWFAAVGSEHGVSDNTINVRHALYDLSRYHKMRTMPLNTGVWFLFRIRGCSKVGFHQYVSASGLIMDTGLDQWLTNDGAQWLAM